MNQRRTYVVAYDIRDPRRLLRVHRAMTGLGHPLQYSVFAADLNPGEKAEAIATLTRLIAPDRDDVRVYSVPSALFGAWRGPLLSPAGLIMPSSPAAGLAERLKRRLFGGGRE